MLLLSDADRTDAAASLLPDVLHMLATTHAELGKYRRAAEYFNRALAACNTIYGKGHVRCCPVLRGWARMALPLADFRLFKVGKPYPYPYP